MLRLDLYPSNFYWETVVRVSAKLVAASVAGMLGAPKSPAGELVEPSAIGMGVLTATVDGELAKLAATVEADELRLRGELVAVADTVVGLELFKALGVTRRAAASTKAGLGKRAAT